MNRVLLVVIISLLATDAIAQPESAPPEKKSSERLGIRLGWVGTSSGLRDSFGDGVQLSLHWIQPVRGRFSVNVSLGAFYMGTTDRRDLTETIFYPVPDEVSLRIISIAAAPRFEFPVGTSASFFVSSGVGIYSVTLLLDSGPLTGDETDTHFGFSVGTGLVYQMSTNWFLELQGETHKFWTGNDMRDIVFVYSEGERNPLFYQISAGVMLRMF